MSKTNLLKEAIAEAKTIKEVAIANAKIALEEAFTPYLKEKLSLKLQEMDNEEELPDMSNVHRGGFEEDSIYKEFEDGINSLKNSSDAAGYALEYLNALSDPEDENGLLFLKALKTEFGNDFGKISDVLRYGYTKEPDEMDILKMKDIKAFKKKYPEATKAVLLEVETEVTETEETVEEGEFSLDELLAELEEGNEENLNENEEIVAEKKDEEESEDEEVTIEDMTQEDLEGLIADIIKDMVASGELEPSEDEATEEAEEEIEIEDENDEVEPLEESEEITEGAWDKIKGVVSGVAKAANMFKQPAEFVKEMDAALKETPALKDDEQFMSTYNFLKGLSTASKASATTAVNRPMEETAQLAEAMETIKKLSNDLNEINVLNSKLLYTNKIFRANTLNENQKIKVLSSFDKAKTKKEVELIYETIKGDFAKKAPIRESYLGSASKSIANQITTTSKTSPIVSDGAFERMQKLAGIKK